MMSLSQTIQKMNEMKLFGMARSLGQIPSNQSLTPEEFLGLVVDEEYLYRKNNRLKRLLQNAKLKIPQACFEEIDYRHVRGLEKSEMLRLQSVEWITSSKNVLITGPTGIGKSYLGCVLGQWACRQDWPALYLGVSS